MDDVLRGLSLQHVEVDEIGTFSGRKQSRLKVKERHDTALRTVHPASADPTDGWRDEAAAGLAASPQWGDGVFLSTKQWRKTRQWRKSTLVYTVRIPKYWI